MDVLDHASVAVGRVARGGFAWVAAASLVAPAGRRLAAVADVAEAVWVADGLAVGASYAIGRPRPCRKRRSLIECPDSPSFPSNHAAGAAAGAVALGRVDGRAFAPAVLAALAVGASRVRVGVHDPMDVVGGGVLGAAVALLAARAPAPWR